jgi:hypothetical protein
MAGGRRRGAGRPRGGGDVRLRLVRNVLAENREKLITKAIKLATGPKPHVNVLCKLLDKILPSLHSQAITGELFNRRPFEDVDPAFLADLMHRYDEIVIEKHQKALIESPILTDDSPTDDTSPINLREDQEQR